MNPEDIIGTPEEVLEIMIDAGAIELNTRTIKEMLGQTTDKEALQRLKTVVAKTRNEQNKKALLEVLVEQGDKYIIEAIEYGREMKVKDETLLEIIRKYSSSSLKNYATGFEPKIAKEIIKTIEEIKTRNEKTIMGAEYETLGKAYYATALEDEIAEHFDKAIENFEKAGRDKTTMYNEQYTNSFLIRGVDDKQKWKKGLERYQYSRMNAIRTLELIERFNPKIEGYDATRRIAEFLIDANTTKAAEKAIPYFDKAQKEAKNYKERAEIFEKIRGKYLLMTKEPEKAKEMLTNLSDEMFDDPEADRKWIAEKLFETGDKELKKHGKKLLKKQATQAKSLEEYLQVYEPLIKDSGMQTSGTDEKRNILIKGLERFNTKQDYEKAVEFVDKQYGNNRYQYESGLKIIEYIEEKGPNMNQGNKKILDDYKQTVEEKIKDAKERLKIEIAREEARQKLAEKERKKMDKLLEEIEEQKGKKDKDEERLKKLADEVWEEKEKQEKASPSQIIYNDDKKTIEELLKETASHNLPVYEQPNVTDEDKNTGHLIKKIYKNFHYENKYDEIINKISLNKHIEKKDVYDFKENKDIF